MSGSNESVIESHLELVLNELLRVYGVSILSHAGQLYGHLLDHAPNAKRDAKLLIHAVHAGIPQDLLAWLLDKGKDHPQGELSRRLTEQHGTSPALANWAVSTWSNAIRSLQTLNTQGDSSSHSHLRSDACQEDTGLLCDPLSGESEAVRDIFAKQETDWEIAIVGEMLRSRTAQISRYRKPATLSIDLTRSSRMDASGHILFQKSLVKKVMALSKTLCRDFARQLMEGWGEPGVSADPVKIRNAIDLAMDVYRQANSALAEIDSIIPPYGHENMHSISRMMFSRVIDGVFDWELAIHHACWQARASKVDVHIKVAAPGSWVADIGVLMGMIDELEWKLRR